MSKGPRAKFHAAAIPANHVAIRNQPGSMRACHRKVRKRADLDTTLKFFEGFLNLRERLGRSVERNRNARVVNAAVLSRAKGGRSQCGAVVPGGRLHKDFVKNARLH